MRIADSAISLAGNFKIIFPIILFAVFSLPDVLRRKRTYKKRRKSRSFPIPARQEKKKRDPLIAETKEKEIRQENTASFPAAIVGPDKKAATIASPMRSSARRRPVSGDGWHEVAPEAQDLYAGIIWSEILQPPLAIRSRQHRK